MEAQEDLDKNVESQIELHEDLAAGQADLAENQQTIDKLKDQLQTVSKLTSNCILTLTKLK